jgi:ketosteroid isomerase-like protein
MSRENVEIIKRMVEAYNAGDLDTLEGFYTPDVEALPDASVFPEAGPLRGREEWRVWIDQIGAAWTAPHYGISELFAADDGRVVHRGDWGGEGATSGIETVSSITGVYTVRDGQVSRVEYFFDHAEALKAVGLEA